MRSFGTIENTLLSLRLELGCGVNSSPRRLFYVKGTLPLTSCKSHSQGFPANWELIPAKASRVSGVVFRQQFSAIECLFSPFVVLSLSWNSNDAQAK